MKRTIYSIGILLVLAGVLLLYSPQTKYYSKNTPINVSPSPLVDKSTCVGEACLKVPALTYPAGSLQQNAQSALNKALADEYKAHATYQAVIEKFGMVRPFSMIIRSEEQHIASLKTLYDKYGIPVPEDQTGKVTVPQTLQESCQIGVEAEIANAALYRDTLLPQVKDYPDITSVFTLLMNASQQRHLIAFNKCK